MGYICVSLMASIVIAFVVGTCNLTFFEFKITKRSVNAFIFLETLVKLSIFLI